MEDVVAHRRRAVGSGSGESTRLEDSVRARALAFAVIGSSALLASPVSAQRAPGGVTIYDSIGCSKDIRAAKVTVPFSIGVTGLDPNSSTEFFVTDKDANPDVVYGPGIFTADENGNICLDIFDAPAGTWKIDVVEQGSGFTDSKVFTVEETETPPITLPSTTTTTPGLRPAPASTTTTTSAPPTTRRARPPRSDHHDVGTATTQATTTTLAPPTTRADHHDHVGAADHPGDHHHHHARRRQRRQGRQRRLRPPHRRRPPSRRRTPSRGR